MNTINFSTPYAWDGTSNIVVEMAYTGIDNINNAQTFYTTTTGNKVAYGYNGAATASLSTSRFNTVFTGVASSPITSVTWMNGASTVGTGNPFTANPATTTTYTANILASGCVFAPAPTATVTVNPLPSSVTATNSAQCGVQVPTASVTSTTGAPTPTFKWYPTAVGGVASQTSTSTTYTSTVAVTTTFYVSEVNGVTGCESARTPVTVNVSTPDPVSAGAAPTTFCLGGSVTLTAANTNPTPFQSYTYSWTGAAGSGAVTPVAGATATVTPTAAGTYVYTVTAVDGGCTATNTTVSVTVNPNPTAVVAAVTDNDICNGTAVNLSVTATSNYGSSTLTPLVQNFDAGLGAWTTTYSGTAPAASGWVSQNAPYSYTTYFTNFATPQGGGFAMSNGDIGGSGLKTRAALSSPTFSTVGMANATLTFQNLYQKWNSGDSLVRLEISTNGGSTWTTLKDYLPLGSQGNVTSGSQVPANESIVLTAGYLNQANMKIRFNYVTAWGYYWVIDNLKITGAAIDPTTYAWTSAPAGFTSSVQNPPAVSPAVSTTYNVNVTNGFGCSATGSVAVTVHQPTTASITPAPTCVSYTLNGTTYTTSGTYTQTLVNAAGCDSTLTANITILQPTTSTMSQSACVSYTLNGTTYNTSGTYVQHLTNAAGCDSTITLTLIIKQPTTSTLTTSACNTYILNGTTYNTSGTYVQHLTNAAGCDSSLTLNLTINNATSSTLPFTACSSFTYNGSTYTATGSYNTTLTNAAGCDSLVTLNITITQPTTATINGTGCNSYTLNGTTYNASGTYTQMLTNAAGCDSTLTLNLVLNNTFATITDTACSSYTYNGTTYNASGTYTQTLMNVAGCDSTVTLNLTIHQPTTLALTQSSCVSYTLNGTTYTTSGTYTQTLTNAAGCDSTITLTLTINQPTTASMTVSECESFTYNGTTYTTSGTYTQTLTNMAGCDSTVTINLTIIGVPTATATDNGDHTITASTGTTYQWIHCATGLPIAGATTQTYTATVNGTYAVVVTNAGGCSDTSNCVTIANIGIKELTDASIQVFPNPTHSDVTITMSSANATIEVVDAQGKVLQAATVVNGAKVDLSAYETGVYFLRIQTDNGSAVERIVKN